MPFTFLAHQAPVLPLKLWRPRWFSGAGLAIGSMAPDFEKFVHGPDAGRFGHTLLGLFVYCLPMSLAVYWLLTRVAAPALARYAPGLGRFHLRDYAASLAAAPGGRWWVVVAISIVLGAASHVAFDGFTHADPRVTALFPLLGDRLVSVRGRPYPLLPLLQVGATAAGAAFVLGMMYFIGRRRRALAWRGLSPASASPSEPRPGAARRYWLTVALVTAVLSGAFAAVEVDGGRRYGDYYFIFAVVLRLPLSGFAAACIAALVDRARHRKPAPLPSERRPPAAGRRGRRTPQHVPHHSSRSRARTG